MCYLPSPDGIKHCHHSLLFVLFILAGRAKGHGNIGHEELARIIGGVAVEDRLSYAVLMMGADGSRMCGGSLIARDVVLTAAHGKGATDYARAGNDCTFVAVTAGWIVPG